MISSPRDPQGARKAHDLLPSADSGSLGRTGAHEFPSFYRMIGIRPFPLREDFFAGLS